MSTELGIGVIGCGNISTAYLTLSKMFRGIKILACADKDESAAKSQAEKFGIRAMGVDSLLSDDSIEIVVNLTVPAAHFEVSKKILESGKHVFSEKPFVLNLSEGKQLSELAAGRGLRIGSAPDTFLGGAHQLSRHLVDEKKIGDITSGSCHVMSQGMEVWHPNPDFFYKIGGGPILDIGPYYVANLVNLIGPVTRVASYGSIPSLERTILNGPRYGQKISVETPTTILALLEFENGALVSLSASWDVWKHNHRNMELYGSSGTLFLPDPNFFGGDVHYSEKDGGIKKFENWSHPLSVPNLDHARGKLANYRTIGLAEMADSIIKGRTHRCSLNFALHVIEVLIGILSSSESGEFVKINTSCPKPAPLSPNEAESLMK